MATSKKVSDLTALTAVSADDLVYTVDDPLGIPNSRKITVKAFMESNATSNVVANGSAVLAGISSSNVGVSRYTGTPASASAVPAGFPIGATWSDGSFIYTVTGASALK